MSPSCLWQTILQLNLLHINYEMGDIWHGGPTLLNIIAEKFTNLFWKEILQTFSLITRDLHFSHPYFFYNLDIFDNPLFSINGTELNSLDFGTLWQRWKLCRKLGRSFPVGLGTSSRILRGSPVFFVLSRNFAVTYALFGYFGGNLPDFPHFWVNFVHFLANFEHFLNAFISRFSVNGSDSQ